LISQDKSLKEYNTFGVESIAAHYAPITCLSDLRELILSDVYQTEQRLILGGGSNLLLVGDFKGLVIHNLLEGIKVMKVGSETVQVEAMAGESWHELVQFCVEGNLGGIENLSLIPGSVGAAPMQNIGAYGVELKDCFVSLDAMHLESGQIKTFNKVQCGFGYRTSAFKEELRDQYIILSVLLELQIEPKFNLSYGKVQEVIDADYGGEISVKNVSAAICSIRESKLPDPAKIGNSGSFFKNAFIKKSHYKTLTALYDDIPHYPAEYDMVKIPSAWLIEQCGWKGKVVGNTGTYKNHSLVLVNHGAASGQEVYDLSNEIMKSVKDKFDIDLMREVNIVRS